MYPKRRKYNDNPYIIAFDNNIYRVIFSDSNNKRNEVVVSKEVYESFNRFELDDLKQMNEYDRHIEHLELSESNLFKKSNFYTDSLDNIVEKEINIEKLKNALIKLPYKQRKRIEMYYFEEMTQQEIATIEGVSIRAIQYSLNDAIKKLRKILKK